MAFAIVYLLSATCYVNNQDEKRRYYGVCKVYANQIAESAVAARLAYHVSHLVDWMKHSIPETMTITPLGHVLSKQNALAEEAIRTAHAFMDGGDPVRGGPWSRPHVGSVGRSEMKAVCRKASRAEDAAAAREAVLAYVSNLTDTSPLRRHCENLKYGRDTAPFGGARKKEWSQRRGNLSGCQKRKNRGMVPGSLGGAHMGIGHRS